VTPDQNIRIAVNSYLADGSGGFSVLAEGTDRTPGPGDHEALVTYFENNSPVAPPALDRVSYRIP
jgi:5'-nucleotidase